MSGPLLQQMGEQATVSLACSPPEGRQAYFLYGVRVGVCPGVRAEGWLRCFAHPLEGGVCRAHAQYPAFTPDMLFLLPGSSKLAVGFFGLFVSFRYRICPNCSCTQLFLVPYSFFVFCCWRRGVSRCKHCSKGAHVPAKGPRSQPVSFPYHSVSTHSDVLS